MSEHTQHAADIATELTNLTGEQWRPGNPEGWTERVTRTRDGMTLSLFWRGTDYWIDLDLPSEVRQTLRYDEHEPRIGCNWPNRSAKSVARDIQRRLLNDAETMFVTAQARYAAHRDYVNRQRANWERVAEVTGVTIPTDMDSYQYVRLPGGNLATVKCSGSGVSIDVSMVPIDAAVVALKGLLS